MNDIKIAANDPTLAHALATHELDKLRLGSDKLFAKMSGGAMSVGSISKLLRGHFKKLLLEENIARLHGSRASALWYLLDTAANGDLVVVAVRVDKNSCRVDELRVGLSPHTVARFFQRTQGTSDLQGVAQLVKHIHLAMALLDDSIPQIGDEVVTAANDGVLMWKVLPARSENIAYLRAATWISAGQAVDPGLIEAMGRASDTHLLAVVRRDPCH